MIPRAFRSQLHGTDGLFRRPAFRPEIRFRLRFGYGQVEFPTDINARYEPSLYLFNVTRIIR